MKYVSKRDQRLYKTFQAERGMLDDVVATPSKPATNLISGLVVIVVFVINSLLLSGCGDPGTQFVASPACQVVALEGGGAEIECPDGTHQVIKDGHDGSVGAIGQQGIAGVAGKDGSSCNVLNVAGGADVECADGSAGFISNGQVGPKGDQGTSGQDITPITMVQFCDAGYIPMYPSVFPEYGMLIGGKLYGVYSANGGFLVQLPPGTYSSNGINASCTFTVHADNTITQD